jgi:hypothetical protein
VELQTTPNIGTLASAESIRSIAQHAEKIVNDSKGKRQDFEVVYRAFWHPTKDEFKKMEEVGVTHVILRFEFWRAGARRRTETDGGN